MASAYKPTKTVLPLTKAGEPRQRASGTSMADMLVVGERWRRNGSMRFLRLATIDVDEKVVRGSFSDGAQIAVSFSDLRTYYTRIDGR